MQDIVHSDIGHNDKPGTNLFIRQYNEMCTKLQTQRKFSKFTYKVQITI